MVNFVSSFSSQEAQQNAHERSAHQEYIIYSNLDDVDVIENNYALPLSAFLGTAGMPGEMCCVSFIPSLTSFKARPHTWLGRNILMLRR